MERHDMASPAGWMHLIVVRVCFRPDALAIKILCEAAETTKVHWRLGWRDQSPPHLSKSSRVCHWFPVSVGKTSIFFVTSRRGHLFVN